jgi:TRAP transporter TAXI family solute receptor
MAGQPYDEADVASRIPCPTEAWIGHSGQMWRRSKAAGSALVALACTACASTVSPGIPEPVHGQVVISAGNTSGVYYAWSQQLAQQMKITNPRIKMDVERSDGSLSNLERLRNGTADLALTTVDATEIPRRTDLSPAAADAEDQVLQVPIPLKALGRIYDDYVQIVVRADSPMRSVADLAGRRVAVNTPGSGTWLVAGRVLEAARIIVDQRDLGVDDGIAALEQKKVDAVIWSGGIPTPSIATAADRSRLRLLPLDDLAGTLRARYGAVYRPATIPPGRYRGTEDVVTLASANLLVARADADPAMVTAVLSTIFDQRDRIGEAVPAANATDRRTAIWTGTLDLHPAAIDFYRRTKP